MKPNRTLIAIIAALLTAGSLAVKAAAADPLAIICGPYLQSPTETAMTVMWITNRNSTGWVEYGAGGSLERKAISSHDGLIQANVRIHKITLTGLEPGAEYSYRVFSQDILDFGAYKVEYGETISSDVHRFHTLDRNKDQMAFIAFTDIHEHLDMVPQLLAVNGDRPFDFVVFIGDIISHIEGEQQIVDFINSTVEHFASEIPFVWVRGNHETRGKFARMLPRYIASPTGRYFYSFTHGPAHFIVLDTGEDKADTSTEYSGLVDFDAYRREQSEWLQAEIRSDAFRDAEFRVGLAHMPFPRPPGQRPHGMNDAFVNFGPYFNEGKVDVLFSGHQHRYGIHEPVEGRHNYPVIQGGAYGEDSRTLIRVEVSRRLLKAAIIRADGTVVATREIPAQSR